MFFLHHTSKMSVSLRISRLSYAFIKFNSKYLEQKCYFLHKTVSTNVLISKNCHTRNTESSKKIAKSFLELVCQRRNEAKRSIIVHVRSAESSEDLFTYCSQYGTVTSMHHYRAGSNYSEHFIIVEFQLEQEVASILQRSYHVSHDKNKHPIPVQSTFLQFLPNNNKTKDKRIVTVDREKPHMSENSTKIMTNDELHRLLIKSENVSEQMTTLHKNTCLGETGTRLRYFAARQVELALSGMFPDIAALPFGSSVNGFGREGSDLDLVLQLNPKRIENRRSRLVFHGCKEVILRNGKPQMQIVMQSVADILHVFLPGCANIRRILQATVPIIKYNQVLTGLEIDLSMTNMSGVFMSDLLYTLSSIDDRVTPLVFAVRKWAQLTKVTDNSPGPWITNFSLTLLVLAFLQKVEILPPIKLLFELAESDDKAVTEDGIDCSFLHDLSKLPRKSNVNTDSLETLFLKFFEHYSLFDFFSNAVSLHLGRAIAKPERYSLYIVNPLERSLNVSRNVSNEQLDRLQSEFRKAAFKLCDSSPARDKNWGILDFSSDVHNVPFTQYHQQNAKHINLINIFDEALENTVEYKNNRTRVEVNQIRKNTKKLIKSIDLSDRKKILNTKKR